jgi:uncharacterized protein YukE
MSDDADPEVDELHEALNSALEKRDYSRALLLQEALRQSAAEYERLRRQQAAESLSAQVAQLERDRAEEQFRLEEAVDQQISAILQYFTGLYDQIEQRHSKATAELERKFDPATFMVKLSPTVRNLKRAEDFYVKNGDYRSAAQVRKQIQTETRKEVLEFEKRTKATIEAAKRDALRQYQAEQKSFDQRLENEKNILKRDADRQILTIENKYHKLYHNLTKRAEKGMGGSGEFRVALHSHIDSKFAEFVGELVRNGSEANPEEEQQEVKPRVASARRERASSVRRVRNPRVDLALARANNTPARGRTAEGN